MDKLHQTTKTLRCTEYANMCGVCQHVRSMPTCVEHANMCVSLRVFVLATCIIEALVLVATHASQQVLVLDSIKGNLRYLYVMGHEEGEGSGS